MNQDFSFKEDFNISIQLSNIDHSLKKSFINVYVLIDGLTPKCLKCYSVDKLSKIQKIVLDYYRNDLFSSDPPGKLKLVKSVIFRNGDMIIFYKREKDMFNEFQYNIQKKILINKEFPPNQWSIEQTTIRNQIFPNVISLNRLILLLTDPYVSKELSDVFLYTYRLYVSQEILISKLIQRYDVPLVDFKNESKDEKTYFEDLKRKIKLKICGLLYNIVDDIQSEKIDEIIRKFCLDNLDEFKFLFHKILKSLDKNMKKAKPKPKSLKKNQAIIKSFHSLTFNEEKFAKYLFNYMLKIYREISFMDIIKWGEGVNSPIIYLSLSKKLQNWIISHFVVDRSMEKKKMVYKKFVKLGELLVSSNCVNVLGGFYEVLNDKSIKENLCDESDENVSINLNKYNIVKNSEFIKREMDVCFKNGDPCCPMIDVYYDDLMESFELPSLIEGKVNFKKCVIIYDKIKRILRFQNIETNDLVNETDYDFSFLQ